MGHAFEHCEWKDNIKIKRFGEKKVKVSGLLFFFIDAYARVRFQLVKTQRHGFMQQDKLVCMTNRVLFISVRTIKLILILIVNTCKNHRTSFNSNTCKNLS